MERRRFLSTVGASAAAAALGASAVAQTDERTPNIVFILADDLGYGDLGCYGQKRIKTPNIDRMAAEGIRFTDAYAGSTVCAPSRCVLMTGQHTGHCIIRGNGRVPLRPHDVTVAEVLKASGYATGIVGKWGCGEAGSTGIPNKQGFDYWFGYLNQHRAHNYWPDYLWKNTEKFPLENVVTRNVASVRKQYSQDLFIKEALAFIESHKHKPFFLYLPVTIPHANNEAGRQGMEIPSDAPYTNQDWPQQQKNHAAMITRLDADVGRVLALLKKLGLDENTVVFFTSDNGPHREGGADPNFFDANGPLRGIKRDLYEGGIRVPLVARWPGHIPPGRTSDLPTAFWDFYPTAGHIARAALPNQPIDGISVLPTLLGKGEQARHDFLYWEFHEGAYKQAVRMGRWKGVRFGTQEPLELYDLGADVGETKNVAAQHPDVVARIEAYLKTARTPSDTWKPKATRRRRPRRPKPKPKPAAK